MVKSRAIILSQQINQKAIQRYGDIQFAGETANGIRRSIESNKQKVTRRSHVPRFGNERAIARPQHNVQELDIQATKFQIFSCFLAATFVAFSAMFVSDSIAVQAEYLRPILNKSDSEIGWLSSIIFFPSLFMSIVVAPLVDAWGPILCGILFNVFNFIISLIMPFVWKNFSALLFVRLLFGFLNEPCWLVQSALISKYLPLRLESMAFGVCMSIATSANLIGFFAVPPIMKVAGDDQDKYIAQLDFTFWLNPIISGVFLVIFILTCIPLMKLDKQYKDMKRRQALMAVEAQDVRFDRVTQSINISIDLYNEEMPVGIQTKPVAKVGPSPSQGFLHVLRQLKDFTLKIPNNFKGLYKVAQSFKLSADYWLICFSYVLLLSTCYGSQTMLLTFLGYRGDDVFLNGILRSVMSVVGGPVSGFIVQWFGNRPLLLIGSFVLSILAFLSLFLTAIPAPLPIVFIGFFDGCAAGLAKSLFTYVVKPRLLNNAYAISGALLNLGQFAFPPAAGAVILNFPMLGSGIIWFYVGVLVIGLGITVVLVVRDKTIYHGILGKKP